MKSLERKTEKPVLVLLCIVAALVLAILAGTIWAFARRILHPGSSNGQPAAESEAMAGMGVAGEARGFLEIGRIRTELAPEIGSETGAVLIVKASIPYSLSDGQFQEELVRKLPEIRDAVRTFFSLCTLAEIQGTAEAELKKMLLERINRLLVLGKPEEIYFEEFIFFE